MFKLALSLLVCASAMASPVLAGGGGGGAKKDGNIRVVHNLPVGSLTALGAGNDSFIVIADPPVSLVAKVNSGTAVPNDIVAAGGVIIKVGRSATIPVKSGNVRLYGAAVASGSIAGRAVPVTAVIIPVAKGQTVTLNASSAPVAIGAPWPAP